MFRFRLPVSRIEAVLREPAGAEEAFLYEAGDGYADLALRTAEILARTRNGEVIAFASLSITDLDAAMLAIRRMALGDAIRTTVQCACKDRIEIGFGIAEYLEHHAPRRPRQVRGPCAEEWWEIDGGEGRFRLPSVADQLAISVHPDPLGELERRCFRPAELTKRDRRRMEAAMAAMAPDLFGALQGTCPNCAATVQVAFDPQQYVVAELRLRAAFVFEEVHMLAARYGWHERDILAMPHSRRARYAELIHEDESGGAR